MENNTLLETIARGFGQNASIKNVYGEPVTAHGRTIIPVAKIAMGLGGGYGVKKDKKQKLAETAERPQDNNNGEGSGAGGGMYATAKGVYEITDKGTCFIPADATKQLLAIAAIAFVTGRWVGRRKRKNEQFIGHKA
jgi:uncharacterized spore protein YtfJ